MTRPLPVLATLALSMLVTAASVRAEVERDRFVLQGMSSDISADVADACSSTVFFVSGQETVLREGAPAQPGKAAFMSYWTFDACTGRTTFGVGSQWDPGPSYDVNFNRASLQATFLVENFSYTEDPLDEMESWTSVATVSAGWSGKGAVTTYSDGFNIQFGGLLWTSHSAVQQRSADVTLEVTVDGDPMAFDVVAGGTSKSGWSNLILRGP
jgi:hypothetical protein